jgi:hypothetical protein
MVRYRHQFILFGSVLLLLFAAAVCLLLWAMKFALFVDDLRWSAVLLLF